MHQPDYRDPETGTALLPWVRLHAAKDYADMAARAAVHPRVRTTFNLTPVLLEQLLQLAGGSRDAWDRLARRPASALTLADRQVLLRQTFMVNWEHAVDPLPRYRELLDRRGRRFADADAAAVAQRFTDQDFTDLVVLFHLTWTDRWWDGRFPRLRALREKARGYTHAEQLEVLDLQRALMGEVIPLYRRLQDEGRIEISTTPYFHPIGPLLLDQTAMREARPEAALPGRLFTGERDAAWHLAEARRLHTELFGRAPTGLWPSEGSISEAFVRLAGGQGFAWAASDEAVLAASRALAGEAPRDDDRFRPWRRDGVALLFRDRYLSDLIGFVYARWKPAEAAAHFVERVREAGRRAGPGPDGSPPLVTVILDGENAWEYYEHDGADFLDALYAALNAADDLECVTPSQYLTEWPNAPRELPRLRAGSWINADFGIWMGHQEDRMAWEAVAEARQALLEREATLPPAAFADAWRSLMAAEGSDWTWWYGDDHFTPLAGEFDRLFRGHLARVWSGAGLEVPAGLARPIKRLDERVEWQPPADVLDVILDGRVTNYYEWLAAGRLVGAEAGSAMHRGLNLLSELRFACDRNGHLAIRLDPHPEHGVFEHGDMEVEVAVSEPVAGKAVFGRTPEGWTARWEGEGPAPDARAEAGAIFELILKVGRLSKAPQRAFTVALRDRITGRILQRWPSEGSFNFLAGPPADEARDWVV